METFKNLEIGHKVKINKKWHVVKHINESNTLIKVIGLSGSFQLGHVDEFETEQQNNPTPEQIKQARKEAVLTQTQAAKLVHCDLRAWQKWEGAERKMHAAMWELFLIKTQAESS